jgi:hypothetical protein
MYKYLNCGRGLGKRGERPSEVDTWITQYKEVILNDVE